MTATPTLPPLAELPVGLRKFHNLMSERAQKEKCELLRVCENKPIPGTPWNDELPRCRFTTMTISYDPSTRTLGVTIWGRNEDDEHSETHPRGYAMWVADWPSKVTYRYSLHGDLPVGTKKFLLGLR